MKFAGYMAPKSFKLAIIVFSIVYLFIVTVEVSTTGVANNFSTLA